MNKSLKLLVVGLIAFLFVASVSAALYDRKRGLQTYNLPDEHVAAYLKSRDVNTIIGKMKEKDQAEEHPEVQRFLNWKNNLKAGDGSAGVAFAGKIPHDYLHRLTTKEGSEL